MGVEREQAIAILRDMASVITGQWRERIGDQMSGIAIDQLAAAFRLAEEVRDFDFAVLPVPSKSRRYPQTRRGC